MTLNLNADGSCDDRHDLQRAVAAVLEARGVADLAARAPPGGLLLWRRGKSFAMEFRRHGRASEGQLAFLSDMDRAGAYVALPDNLESAVATLEAWGLLKGMAS